MVAASMISLETDGDVTCRRRTSRHFACRTTAFSPDGDKAARSTITLRDDGLIRYRDPDTTMLFEPLER